jgi:RNA polymerase sigma-70 factor (ECF subfamily)
MRPDAARALERVFREERVALLATLTRHLGGDVGLAEDALQDAFAAAAREWPRTGPPERPGAWLTVAARRRALDRLRREQAQGRRALALEEALRAAGDEGDEAVGGEIAERLVPDDRLRLLFTCCHPALDLDARVALTLRAVGGLSTDALARGFLTTEPAMSRRLVRARRKIVDARIPYRVPAEPAELAERLAGVLHVVYLVYTEGHTATTGDALTRPDLAAEAVRLGRLLAELAPGEPEVLGLLALMLLTEARRPARTAPDGAFVALADQDRSRYDAPLVAEGTALLERALAAGRPGPFQAQAAIAALHAGAPSYAETDWAQIAALYAALAAMTPSPVVEVNRAVAVAMADGPRAGLAVLGALAGDPRAERYQPLHAARAELLLRAGDAPGARAAYARAIALSANAAERAELERRAGQAG